MEQKGTVPRAKQTSAGTALIDNKIFKKSKTSTVSVRPSRNASRIFLMLDTKKMCKFCKFWERRLEECVTAWLGGPHPFVRPLCQAT